MPIYNYWCPRCSATFESVEKIEEEFIFCKKCGYDGAERQFTPTRFIPFRSFVTEDITGQPMEIGSPRQFSKELHSRGLEVSDRPIRHKRKKFGLTDKAKREFQDTLGKELMKYAT